MPQPPPQEPVQPDDGDYTVASAGAVPVAVYFRELVIDLIATLVPGLWFVAATVPAIIIPIFWFIRLLDGDSSSQTFETIKDMSALGGIEALTKAASAFHWELFLSGLAASFLIGQIMFRQDLEKPDKFSWMMVNMHRTHYSKRSLAFRWIWRTLRTDVVFTITEEDAGEFDGAVRPPKDRKCKMGEVRVQFPYSHLKIYLVERGFIDLAELVNWEVDPDDPFGRIKKRTKQFINDKKAILEFYFPNNLRELTRIEGHIRLHSSLWYVSYYLGYISVIGLCFGLLANIILWYRFRFGLLKMEILLLPIAIYCISSFIQHLIENAFHYQRTREVFYVLTLFKLSKDASRAPLIRW